MTKLGTASKAERHCCADDKQEQRHDQVVAREPDPARVVELMLPLLDPSGFRQHREDSEDELAATDNPKHIETAERVERENACRWGSCGCRCRGRLQSGFRLGGDGAGGLWWVWGHVQCYMEKVNLGQWR